MGPHYINKANFKKGLYWYTGDDALKKGRGLNFDFNLLSATTGQAVTDAWGKRGMKAVAKPDTTNNMSFAGIITQNYKAKTGGQLVELHEPGGCAYISVLADTVCSATTVVGNTVLTCGVGTAFDGRFAFKGLPGRGTAIALQSVTAVKAEDLAGGAALDATGKIITDSGAGLSNVAVGDKVIIFAGEDDGSTAYIPETYTVAAVDDSADTITLSEAASDGGAMHISYICVTDNPVTLAYLMDGEESGGLEVLSPINKDPAQHMVGGTTLVGGGYTLGAGVSTATLADGVLDGMKKAFCGLGTLTTNGYVVTVTSGLEADMSALATITVDAALEMAVLQWNGSIGGSTAGLWRELVSAGSTKG